MSTVFCPGCDEELELDDAYRDWKVRCPQCGREFVPGEPERPQPVAEEEDEVGEEFVYGYQGAAREEALALVRGPGLALELTGWLTFAVFGIGFLIVAIGAMSGNDVQGLLCSGCCFGIFVLPYSLGIALGGRHLRRLTSRSWAMTGAILGLMSFFSCIGVIHGILGIWAITVIDKPVVRRAFELPAPNRRRWD